MTTKENIVLPPPMETNNISLAPSNTLSWTDRVENSTPSSSPGFSLCPDGDQSPSFSRSGATIVSDCPIFHH
ncbi:hypothetical protein TNCT_736431 [Trichonephila clavata]|uniref:Uncharacterized protein n=1 Tax=Trichonephila clavata TaxID=2740835 RepID=A0A8X6L6Z3_TRICU|nr:hypothetical protein TNCT_736431 [Trichonephila clavata]